MMDQNGKKFSELSWECVPVSQAVVEAFLGRRMKEAVESKEGLLVQGAGDAEKEVFRKIVLFVSFLRVYPQKSPVFNGISLLSCLSLTDFLEQSQFLLHTVEQALPSLLEFGIIAPSSSSGLIRSSQPSPIDTLRLEIDEVAQNLLPEIVGLTDAFGFSDWELNTVVSPHDRFSCSADR
jgi:acyl-CoA oxidase